MQTNHVLEVGKFQLEKGEGAFGQVPPPQHDHAANASGRQGLKCRGYHLVKIAPCESVAANVTALTAGAP